MSICLHSVSIIQNTLYRRISFTVPLVILRLSLELSLSVYRHSTSSLLTLRQEVPLVMSQINQSSSRSKTTSTTRKTNYVDTNGLAGHMSTKDLHEHARPTSGISA